jgi:hypothetical protein
LWLRLKCARPTINEVTDMLHRAPPSTPIEVRNKVATTKVGSYRSAARRPIKDQGKTRSTKPKVQATDWELADERLDEALRHTFPASDALSIVQNGRGS